MYYYLLKIAYDGRKFHGVIPQKNTNTVLGEIFVNVGVTKELIKYNVVSRTDKGVSAEENYVMISSKKPIDWLSFKHSDIKILKIFEVKEYLILRRYSKGKIYYYNLPKSLFDEKFIFKPKYLIIDTFKISIDYEDKEFDISLYKKGADYFVGLHRFFNFAKGYVENDMCRIYRYKIYDNEDFWVNEIYGNRFLYEMIRRIISFLVAVGKSRFPLDKIDLVLSEARLDPKPPAAPPEYLTLKKVFLDWNKIYKVLKEVIL